MTDIPGCPNLLRDIPNLLISVADTRECVRRHGHLAGCGPEHVISIGKASREMIDAFLSYERGTLPRSMICVSPSGNGCGAPIYAGLNMTSFQAGHPFPDEGSFAAARFTLAASSRINMGSNVLALISGGASSLFELPLDQISCHDIIASYTRLVSSGRPITDLNTVRRHLSAVKGGNMLRILLDRGASVTVFAISDVPGDHPHDIGSGPFSPDPTTFAEAFDIASRIDGFPETALRLLGDGCAGRFRETLKPGDIDESRYRFHCIASPRMLAERLTEIINRTVEPARLYPFPMSGERSSWVDALCKYLQTSRNEGTELWMTSYGELEVHIPTDIKPGRGGRATSLILELALETKRLSLDIDVAALATDGCDGNSSSAGGYLTADDIAEASTEELVNAVHAFDAATWLGARNRLYPGKPTGTNLGDVLLLRLRSPSPSR